MPHQLSLWSPEETPPAGERLRAARLGVGWSQVRLATEMGVSQPTLSRLERGISTLSVDDLDRAAAVLGLPFESVLGSGRPIIHRRRSSGRRGADRLSGLLAHAMLAWSIDEFLDGGGCLRALHAARGGRQPLAASQARIILSLARSPKALDRAPPPKAAMTEGWAGDAGVHAPRLLRSSKADP